MTEALITNKADRLKTVKQERVAKATTEAGQSTNISNKESRPKFMRVRKAIAALAVVLVGLGTHPTEAKTIPDLDSDTKIVSLGDSPLSGVSDKVAHVYNDCFYDEVSSVDIAAAELGVELVNVACFSSSIDEMETGKFGNPSQYESLTKDTDYVILSMGANAVNLSEMINICLEGSCDYDDPAIKRAIDTVNSDELKEKMKKSHKKIDELSPDADIFQLQYYDIFIEDSVCGAAINLLTGKNISGLNEDYIDSLNYTIEMAVQESREQGIKIHLIEPTKGIAPCESWFQNMNMNFIENPRSSFHPSQSGHRLIADDLIAAIAKINALDNHTVPNKGVADDTRQSEQKLLLELPTFNDLVAASTQARYN